MPSGTNIETPATRWNRYSSGLCDIARQDIRHVRDVVDPFTVSADADQVAFWEVESWSVCEASPQAMTVAGYVCPEKTAEMRRIDAATLASFLPHNAPILLDHGHRFELVEGSHRIARATELALPVIPLLVGKAIPRAPAQRPRV